eukprot:scaffold71892_cov80-Phaeocystis_antarctica.AAC.2
MKLPPPSATSILGVTLPAPSPSAALSESGDGSPALTCDKRAAGLQLRHVGWQPTHPIAAQRSPQARAPPRAPSQLLPRAIARAPRGGAIVPVVEGLEEHEALRLGEAREGARLGSVARERLLAQHVLASPQRRGGPLVVQPVEQGDVHLGRAQYPPRLGAEWRRAGFSSARGCPGRRLGPASADQPLGR